MADQRGADGQHTATGTWNTDTKDTDLRGKDVVDWADLGQEMWSYLTGRGAAVNYNFVDMTVEVPRDTGPEAPRATWKLNGTLRVTTDENATG